MHEPIVQFFKGPSSSIPKGWEVVEPYNRFVYKQTADTVRCINMLFSADDVLQGFRLACAAGLTAGILRHPKGRIDCILWSDGHDNDFVNSGYLDFLLNLPVFKQHLKVAVSVKTLFRHTLTGEGIYLLTLSDYAECDGRLLVQFIKSLRVFTERGIYHHNVNPWPLIKDREDLSPVEKYMFLQRFCIYDNRVRTRTSLHGTTIPYDDFHGTWNTLSYPDTLTKSLLPMSDCNKSDTPYYPDHDFVNGCDNLWSKYNMYTIPVADLFRDARPTKSKVPQNLLAQGRFNNMLAKNMLTSIGDQTDNYQWDAEAFFSVFKSVCRKGKYDGSKKDAA